jgi:hypothetical protein
MIAEIQRAAKMPPFVIEIQNTLAPAKLCGYLRCQTLSRCLQIRNSFAEPWDASPPV